MSIETAVRLIRDTDAEDLAQALQRSRARLAPWEPDRSASYFTVSGQREVASRALADHAQGRSWPGVICVDGALVGQITLYSILRGPFQTCFVGYWVAADHARRGIATRALQLTLEIAFGELALHKVEAFAQLNNQRSRRVLERNGFRQVGVLHRHIYIGGQWQDELHFERIAPWDDGAPRPSFTTRRRPANRTQARHRRSALPSPAVRRCSSRHRGSVRDRGG